jgi:hypothetical protein
MDEVAGDTGVILPFANPDFSAPTNEELDAKISERESRAGERALNAVHNFLGRFVAYPSQHAHTAHALWIAHAHFMDRWESTPRLAFLSPEPGSGKTRALEISELLVPSPVSAVNVSPAYLFRKVGSDEGATVLFDEIDTVFGPKARENEELRGLLNAGHRRGAVAGRCAVHGKEIVTEEIPAYAAVALAGIGWLPDTILSRSIIIRMRRRRAGEVVEQYRRRLHLPEGDAIRFQIESWARSIEGEIEWPELPPAIEDRDADVWEALVAVADLGGGDWPRRAREAAVALVSESRDREPSLGVRLLSDLRTVFGTARQMASASILTALIDLPESPWGDLKGRPLNERGLAHRLRQYSIKPKVIRVGQSTPRGYERTALEDAWSRYLPLPAESATGATSATDQENQAKSVAEAVAGNSTPSDQTQQEKSHKTGVVAGVAVVANLSGHGGERCWCCGEPGRDGDPLLQCVLDGAEPCLHRGCIDPYRAGQEGIPSFLDRRA